MTPKERHETLVKYALEAMERAEAGFTQRTDLDNVLQHMHERMAQAAQLWTDEVDGVPYNLIHDEVQIEHRFPPGYGKEQFQANIGAFFTVKEPEFKFDLKFEIDTPPHPTHFEPGDPNKGRTCVRCGTNIPAGCRYVHADWCNKREKT